MEIEEVGRVYNAVCKTTKLSGAHAKFHAAHFVVGENLPPVYVLQHFCQLEPAVICKSSQIVRCCLRDYCRRISAKANARIVARAFVRRSLAAKIIQRRWRRYQSRKQKTLQKLVRLWTKQDKDSTFGSKQTGSDTEGVTTEGSDSEGAALSTTTYKLPCKPEHKCELIWVLTKGRTILLKAKLHVVRELWRRHRVSFAKEWIHWKKTLADKVRNKVKKEAFEAIQQTFGSDREEEGSTAQQARIQRGKRGANNKVNSRVATVDDAVAERMKAALKAAVKLEPGQPIFKPRLVPQQFFKIDKVDKAFWQELIGQAHQQAFEEIPLTAETAAAIDTAKDFCKQAEAELAKPLPTVDNLGEFTVSVDSGTENERLLAEFGTRTRSTSPLQHTSTPYEFKSKSSFSLSTSASSATRRQQRSLRERLRLPLQTMGPDGGDSISSYFTSDDDFIADPQTTLEPTQQHHNAPNRPTHLTVSTSMLPIYTVQSQPVTPANGPLTTGAIDNRTMSFQLPPRVRKRRLRVKQHNKRSSDINISVVEVPPSNSPLTAGTVHSASDWADESDNSDGYHNDYVSSHSLASLWTASVPSAAAHILTQQGLAAAKSRASLLEAIFAIPSQQHKGDSEDANQNFAPLPNNKPDKRPLSSLHPSTAGKRRSSTPTGARSRSPSPDLAPQPLPAGPTPQEVMIPVRQLLMKLVTKPNREREQLATQQATKEEQKENNNEQPLTAAEAMIQRFLADERELRKALEAGVIPSARISEMEELATSPAMYYIKAFQQNFLQNSPPSDHISVTASSTVSLVPPPIGKVKLSKGIIGNNILQVPPPTATNPLSKCSDSDYESVFVNCNDTWSRDDAVLQKTPIPTLPKPHTSSISPVFNASLKGRKSKFQTHHTQHRHHKQVKLKDFAHTTHYGTRTTGSAPPSPTPQNSEHFQFDSPSHSPSLLVNTITVTNTVNNSKVSITPKHSRQHLEDDLEDDLKDSPEMCGNVEDDDPKEEQEVSSKDKDAEIPSPGDTSVCSFSQHDTNNTLNRDNNPANLQQPAAPLLPTGGVNSKIKKKQKSPVVEGPPFPLRATSLSQPGSGANSPTGRCSIGTAKVLWEALTTESIAQQLAAVNVMFSDTPTTLQLSASEELLTQYQKLNPTHTITQNNGTNKGKPLTGRYPTTTSYNKVPMASTHVGKTDKPDVTPTTTKNKNTTLMSRSDKLRKTRESVPDVLNMDISMSPVKNPAPSPRPKPPNKYSKTPPPPPLNINANKQPAHPDASSKKPEGQSKEDCTVEQDDKLWRALSIPSNMNQIETSPVAEPQHNTENATTPNVSPLTTSLVQSPTEGWSSVPTSPVSHHSQVSKLSYSSDDTTKHIAAITPPSGSGYKLADSTCKMLEDMLDKVAEQMDPKQRPTPQNTSYNNKMSRLFNSIPNCKEALVPKPVDMCQQLNGTTTKRKKARKTKVAPAVTKKKPSQKDTRKKLIMIKGEEIITAKASLAGW